MKFLICRNKACRASIRHDDEVLLNERITCAKCGGTVFDHYTPPDDWRCDFCYAPVTFANHKEYGCNEFNYLTVRYTDGHTEQRGSTGAWAACERCAALIDAGDRQGLLEAALSWEHSPHGQAIEQLLARMPRDERRERQRQIRRGLQSLHAGFWKHRTYKDGKPA